MAQFIRQHFLERMQGVRHQIPSPHQLLPTQTPLLHLHLFFFLPLQDTSNFPGFVTTYMSFLSVFI